MCNQYRQAGDYCLTYDEPASAEAIYEAEIEVCAREVELLEGAYDLAVELWGISSTAAYRIFDQVIDARVEWVKARFALGELGGNA